MPSSSPATPLRIAFAGPAGAGKSTHATLLRQRYKGDVLSFASPLKKLTRDVFGERMDDESFARLANQLLGSACRYIAGPGFWVEKLVVKVSPDRNCFVDDLRYPSEYQALKQLGFTVVTLTAANSTLHERRPAMTPEQWNHDSEQGYLLFNADIYLLTEGSVEETQQSLLARLAQLESLPHS